MRALSAMRRAAMAACAAVTLLATTGCWNAVTLGERAIIQIVAVDPAARGDLRWTFFQANPTALAEMGSGGQTSGPSGGTTSQQVLAMSVVAPTVADAYRKVQSLTSRDLYLGQMEQIVLSESLAAADVRTVIDGMAHTPEVDQSQALLATPGQAAKAVLAPDPQELFPAAFLERPQLCPTCTTVGIVEPLADAFILTRTGWGTLVVPEIRPGPDGIAVRGAAVYRGTQLVARLGEADAVALGLALGVTEKDGISLRVPGLGLVGVRSIHGHTDVTPRWSDGRLQARVRLRLSGDVTTIEPDMGRNLSEIRPLVSRAAAAAILAQERSILSRLLGAGADPLGFGRRLFDADPSAAPSAQAYADAVRHAVVALSVSLDIRSEGSVR